MPYSDQIRATRALIRWSAQELAENAGIGVSTVQRMETANGVPSASRKNLAAIQALKSAGIVFIPENGGGPGVGLK